MMSNLGIKSLADNIKALQDRTCKALWVLLDSNQ